MNKSQQCHLANHSCKCVSNDVFQLESSLKTEWLASKEAAIFLGVSEAQLRNLTSAGRIPYYKFGRLNRYKASELEDLIRKNRRGPYGNQI